MPYSLDAAAGCCFFFIVFLLDEKIEYCIVHVCVSQISILLLNANKFKNIDILLESQRIRCATTATIPLEAYQ